MEKVDGKAIVKPIIGMLEMSLDIHADVIREDEEKAIKEAIKIFEEIGTKDEVSDEDLELMASISEDLKNLTLGKEDEPE